jgi:hypothetical protein
VGDEIVYLPTRNANLMLGDNLLEVLQLCPFHSYSSLAHCLAFVEIHGLPLGE